MEDKDKIIEELKAENMEIKTSYINFIAKLKREMITKDDIQDLKDTAKRFVEERNSLRKENAELKAENDTLKSQLDFEVQKKEVLETENDRLKEELTTYGATGVCEVCSDKANKLADKYLGCLQEIKKIAVMDICSNCITQKREDNCQCLADTILQKITKAESEEV